MVSKNRAIILGCVAGFVMVGGVVLAILLHLTTETIVEGTYGMYLTRDDKWAGIRSIRDFAVPFWTIGLLYVIPGLLGFIAAFMQNKCMYVTTSIFSLIPAIIMGIVVVGVGWALVILASSSSGESQCYDTIDGCECRTDDYLVETMPFKTCDYLETFNTLAVAAMVFIVLPWVVLVAEFVLVVYYACRS